MVWSGLKIWNNPSLASLELNKNLKVNPQILIVEVSLYHNKIKDINYKVFYNLIRNLFLLWYFITFTNPNWWMGHVFAIIWQLSITFKRIKLIKSIEMHSRTYKLIVLSFYKSIVDPIKINKYIDSENIWGFCLIFA
jgi:hypothetical protein